MSTLASNLTARRKTLGMSIADVTARLNAADVQVAESTVAGWFNENRGVRWKMEQLYALVGILQTTIDEMMDGEGVVIEGAKARVALGQRINNMTEEQAQRWLIFLGPEDEKR